MKKQSGFTLIELIVVIVILGILAATALPKFVDFSSNAAQAGVDGVAGGLASASAINYGARQMGKSVTPSTLLGCNNGTDTTTGLWSLLTSGRPSGYTLSTAGTCTNGGSVQCTVSYTVGGTTYNATSGLTCYN